MTPGPAPVLTRRGGGWLLGEVSVRASAGQVLRSRSLGQIWSGVWRKLQSSPWPVSLPCWSARRRHRRHEAERRAGLEGQCTCAAHSQTEAWALCTLGGKGRGEEGRAVAFRQIFPSTLPAPWGSRQAVALCPSFSPMRRVKGPQDTWPAASPCYSPSKKRLVARGWDLATSGPGERGQSQEFLYWEARGLLPAQSLKN